MRETDSDSPLYDATERLLQAVDRLEAGVQHVSVQSARDVHQQQQLKLFERENKTLKQEQEQLSASLTRLQEQYEELKKVATTIYGKLDNAITRITKIVDNNT
jgi:DNA repair exonuclease SbcCD ATPase subunit